MTEHTKPLPIHLMLCLGDDHMYEVNIWLSATTETTEFTPEWRNNGASYCAILLS